MAEKYYPNDNPMIGVGEPVKWHLYLYNHMAEAQYVAVKVKLLGPGVEPPNTTSCTPSPAPTIFEIRRVMTNNETWLSPFEWAIVSLEKKDGLLNLTALKINDQTLNIGLLAPDSGQLRMVFELWLYDKNTGDFRFSWISDGSNQCVWNQIWFNVTSTV